MIGFSICIPIYALLAWLLIRDGFSTEAIFIYSIAATTPFRPVMVVAIAALVILLTRNGGALVDCGSPPPAAPPSPIISAPRS